MGTWKFNELHVICLQALLDDGLARCVYDLHFLILLDETEGIFQIQVEVAPEDIVQVKIHSFLVFFHFLNLYKKSI